MSGKYDVAVIVSVEAEDINKARELVYTMVEDLNANEDGGPENMEFALANDELTTKTNQRVILLHPDDVSSDAYDQEAYNAKLKDQDHDQE